MPLKLSWECRDKEHKACSGRTIDDFPCECECHNDPAPVRARAYPSTNPPKKELVNA
jgi:hypothetical protein